MRQGAAASGFILVLVSAGACIHGDPTDPTATTGSTGTGTTEVPTTGIEGECEVPQHCPSPPQCQQRTCVDHKCVLEFLPQGSSWPSEPGDCKDNICDGAGGITEVSGDDPPPQTPGDCMKISCLNGTAMTGLDATDVPDDGNDCTLDACDGGAPTNTALPVHSACGPGDAQFCHEDGVCRPCKQVSAACEDFGTEPHETQPTAFNLGALTDDDDDGAYYCGTVKGAGDVDWYVYGGVDALGNFVDPVRSLVSFQGSGRVCVYIECQESGTDVDCDPSDTPDTAPLGQQGCCGGGNVSPKLDCGGFDDSATVWIRVDNPDAAPCIPYQLDYHF